MKCLSRFHAPRQGESERRKREGHQEHRNHDQYEAGKFKVCTDCRCKDEKDQSLNRRQGRASEHFAQNDDRATHGSDKNRREKASIAIFNHRHHRED